MSDDTYQGYQNRETWAVSLHLANDQGIYNQVTELAGESDDSTDLADRIESLVTDLVNPRYWRHDVGSDMPDYAITMMQDIGSLWRVEWQEVAEGYAEFIGETVHHVGN